MLDNVWFKGEIIIWSVVTFICLSQWDCMRELTDLGYNVCRYDSTMDWMLNEKMKNIRGNSSGQKIMQVKANAWSVTLCQTSEHGVWNNEKNRPDDSERHKLGTDHPRLGRLGKRVWCLRTRKTRWPKVTSLMMCLGCTRRCVLKQLSITPLSFIIDGSFKVLAYIQSICLHR